MSGLTGVVSQRDVSAINLERMVSDLMHEDSYEQSFYKADAVKVAQVSIGGPVDSGGPAWNRDRTICLFLDGRLFDGDYLGDQTAHLSRRAQDAECCLILYEQWERDFVHHLNGEFNILIHDTRRKRVIIANDRFGIRPWYVVQYGDTILFAPEIKAILASGIVPKRLDEEMIAAFLTFNKMRLGHRTLFRDITVLPPASMWIVDPDRITKEQYWVFRYVEDKPISEVGLADRIVDIYRNAVRIRTSDPSLRYAIALSGGLDSRSIVGALELETRSHIHTFTYGLPDSDEVLLAAEVAHVAGTQHHFFPLQAEDYVDDAVVGMRLFDEGDLFVQGCQIGVYEKMRSVADVVLTGLDLDVTLGGIYIDEKVLAAQTDEDVYELLRARWTIFPLEKLSDLFLPDFFARAGTFPEDFARLLLSKLPQDVPANKYDLFINQYSMRRIIMLRYKLHRFKLETASPMYDYALMDLIRSIPPEIRASHRIFSQFLVRLCPDLARIPYQRTLLPADTPVSFWKEGSRMEAAREKLYREIWAATAGRVFIPYRRYYSNFDEWLRMNPSWQEFTDDLLLTPNTLYQNFLKRIYVEDLVRQHRSGQADHRQQLTFLMTFELFLRTFFQ